MKSLFSWPVFFLLLVLAAVFVYASSGTLPPVVGSHFVVGGAVNGFMPRGDYLILMLGTVVCTPLFMAIVTTSLPRMIPSRFVNLPNREYWLAPERRAETFAYLSRQGIVFAMLLTGFLCFVHWLVVVANRQHPPHLPESLFFVGLSLFIAAVVVWLVIFFVHFRRRSER